MATKMDSTKIARVINDGAVALVKTAEERDAYKAQVEKLAAENHALRVRMEAEKVAMDMHDKGVNSHVGFADLVDQLEKKAHQDPRGFAVLREAVNIAGPDMLKAASVGGSNTASEGSDFERFILGDVS